MVHHENKELEKYGEPLTYDRAFKGPLHNRSCTDVLCLFIFVIFLGCWGYVAYYAFTFGDLHKLLTPTDQFNRRCGQDSGVIDKPYLFFFNLENCIDPFAPITGCPTQQVCVEKCPDELFIYEKDAKKLTDAELKKKLICLNEKDYLTPEQSIKNNRCAKWYVKSKPFLNRCVWDFSSDICPIIPSNLLNNNYMYNSRYKRQIDDRYNNTIINKNHSNSYYFNNYDNNDNDNDDNIIKNLISSQIKTLNFIEEPIEYNTHYKTHQSSSIQNIITTRTTTTTITPIIDDITISSIQNTTEKLKSSTIFPAGLEVYDQKKNEQQKPVNEPTCPVRRILNDEIIMQKVKETDTYLAKFVGNFVAHFYTGENPQDFGQKVVEDIVESWPTVLGALIITMIVSLIFIALMRWIAAPVLWFSIIGALAALAFGIYFCVSEYLYWRENPGVIRTAYNIRGQVQTIFEKESTWLYLSIATSVVFLIILLLVIFLRKRIVIAIALVKEGSKAVGSIISSVFFPILPWCLQILTLGFAIAVGLYLASIGEPTFRVAGILDNKCLCKGPAVNYKKGGLCNPKDFNMYCSETAGSTSSFNFFRGETSLPCTEAGCYFERIQSPTLVTYFHIYNVIGFFWLEFFISALGEMVLAATFATWYWTFHKSDVPYFTTTKAFCRTVRYHLGTLAFGSLILTICRLIRLVLEYIETKLKKYDNAFTRAILCCMKCFFYCLEQFLRFLNRNAYIMCAIHGKNFCSSAKDAFNLLMRNFLRVVTLDKVTDFLFFLSKLLLTIGAGAGTYFYVENYYEGTDKLYYSGVPTAIVVIATYLITSIFFGVYSMAVDTLFLCFLEDCERNDGSEEKPYYMSKQLMKILGRKNIIPRHQYR
ncbi:choline transporter-like 2 isoform X2 [Condylostylus longicornis]|uniref:choline transporter-like 2 isoform X2 n=1 Tax=Condylostylus longicornis TaxID=2530218 RepID=UPI00244E1B26|nr:choline transporter-like 2 isoform X2 [Condylostylus longicornis]XP_055380340.1 choline transporter-like 2 isoform X2 [Condylostylus longicornis]